MKHSILFLSLNACILSQNVDMYLSLIHEGQSQGVKESLPELISKYPNDPGVLYLQALLTSNGMKSLEIATRCVLVAPEMHRPDFMKTNEVIAPDCVTIGVTSASYEPLASFLEKSISSVKLKTMPEEVDNFAPLLILGKES